MVNQHTVFQPIVRLSDWSILGFEALGRFDDGRSPVLHLREAEQAGRLADFELGLISAALIAARYLPPGQLITVNAAAVTILDPRLPALIRQHREHEIGIELSETSELTSYAELHAAIRDAGAVLLIDDAGLRHSDLTRVKDSTPAIVKVDRNLLAAATDVIPDTRGLTTYLQATREVGALTLAEGVETPRQARLLGELGCDLGQGYLFGHPAPADVWAQQIAQTQARS